MLRTSLGSKSRLCTTTQIARVRARNALGKQSPNISTQLCMACPAMTVIPRHPLSAFFLFTRWQSYYQTAVQWAVSWSSTSLDCTLSQQRSTSSSPRPSSRACHSSTHCSRQRRRYERRTFRRRRYSSRCVVASRFSAVSGTWLTDLQSVTVDGRPWKSNCFIEWDVFVRGSTVELELTEDPNVRCGVLPPSLSTGGFS